MRKQHKTLPVTFAEDLVFHAPLADIVAALLLACLLSVAVITERNAAVRVYAPATTLQWASDSSWTKGGWQ